MTIQEIIKKLAQNQFAELYAIPCTVKDYSATDKSCTCSPLNGDADILDVKIQAQPGKGFFMVPTIGSTVIVAMTNSVTGCIVMFSDVDSAQFLDGAFGGLVKVIDLTTKLNNLENKVNALITYINAHVHAANGVAPAPPFTGGSLTATVRGDIENVKVTHGNV